MTTHVDESAEAVWIDPTAFDQVFMNLAINARDAMPSGGQLTMEAEGIELGHRWTAERGISLSPGAYVVISVTDTTTFRVYLPATPRAAGQQEPRPAKAHVVSRARVLVVDDDHAVREVIGRILRDQGHRVIEADSPGHAMMLAEDVGATSISCSPTW